MKIKETDFLYATARIRCLERGFLNREAVEQLIAAPDAQSAAKVLGELGMTWFSEPGTSVESAVSKMRQNAFDLVREISPNPILLRAFQIKYDYHNIKAIIKSAAAGRSCAHLLVDAGSIDAKKLFDLLTRSELTELPPDISAAYTDARDTLARTGDPQAADFVLDRAYYLEMQNIAESSGSTFLQGYVRTLIDAANLRSCVRALRQGKGADFLRTCLFDGGNVSVDTLADAAEVGLMQLFSATRLSEAAREGERAASGQAGLTAFERMCDDAVLSYLQSARHVTFGDAPLVAYLAATENDAMIIRILMAAKLQGLPAEEIRNRLRETYV